MLRKIKNAIFRIKNCAIGAQPQFLLTSRANPDFPPLQLLQLEDRVLYSAVPLEIPHEPVNAIDPNLALLEFADVTHELHSIADLLSSLADDLNLVAASDSNSKSELIIVDTGIEGYQGLLDGIVSSVDGQFQIIYLDHELDGVEQITQLLQQYTGLDAIHLISHGSAGTVQLGNSQLSFDSVARYSNDLTSWGRSLNGDADLLFYGCDLVASTEGLTLVQAVSNLTGADVAASSDLTGHASLGGNWVFEYASGSIEALNIVNGLTQQNWFSVLAATATNDSYSTGENTVLNVPATGVLGNDSSSPPSVVSGATLNYDASLDNDGNGIWEDSTGVSNFDWALNGTVTRNTSLAGAPPGITAAYVFDGTNGGFMSDRMQALPGDPTDGSATFEIWFRPDSPSDNRGMLFDTGSGTNGTNLRLYQNSGDSYIEYVVKQGGLDTVVTANITTEMGSGDFIQLVGTFNATTGRSELFVNGVAVGSDIQAGLNDWADNTEGSGIAKKDGTYASYNDIHFNSLKGQIGVFRMFESVLSGAQVQQNYDAITTTGGSLFVTASDSTSTSGATVSVNANGSFSYNPGSLFNYLKNGESVIDTFTYTVSDGSSSDIGTVSITINGLTEAPTAILPGSFAVNENVNTTGGFSLGTLTATDEDAGDLFTYTIFGGADQAKFTLGGAGSNELILTDGTLDFETQSSYAVTVRVTDSALNTFNQTLTVNVNNLNEALSSTGEFLINNSIANQQVTSAEDRGSQQAVSLAADGSYVLVWTSLNQDSSGQGVYFQRFDSTGAELTAELRVNQSTLNDQQWARVASAADGTFVVTWTSNHNGATAEDIYVRRFAANGTPLTGEILVNTSTTGVQKNSIIGMNSATGEFVVAWQGNGTQAGEVDAAGIFGKRFSSTGTAIGGEFRVNANTANTQYDASISVNNSGEFVVVWDDSAGFHFQRFANTGIEVGGQVTVDGDISSGNGSVAMRNDGSFVVTWRQTNLIFGQGVFTRRYDASGVPSGIPTVVNSTFIGTQTDPSISMDSAGNYIIVWDGAGTGDTDGIFGQKFDSLGAKIGGEFLVNQTTSGSQHSTSAAMQDSNNFVIVWSGNGNQVGQVDTSGVFARQFNTSAANQAPTDIAPNSFAISENTDTTGGTSVGTLSTIDPDVSDSFTYSIVGGADQAKFTIGGASSNELILTDGVLNFETKSTYSVTVRVTDSASNFYEETLTVNVNDLNEAPTVTLTPVVTNLDEDTDTTSAIVVATITVNDDALGSETLSLSGADAGLFEIVGMSLRLKAGAALDFETNPSLDVTVNVDDSTIPGSPDHFANYNITIGDVVEPLIVTAAADTYIANSNSNNNYGVSTSLVVDKSGGGIGSVRTLLQFNLNLIPIGATITSVSLHLEASANTGAFDINIYELTQAWFEGVGNGTAGTASWNQSQAGTNWTTTGATYAAPIVATLNTAAIGRHSWSSLALTSLVQAWYDGSKTNNGLILGSPNIGVDSVTYSSREGIQAPKLEIYYTVANSLPTNISPNSFSINENINTTGGVSVGVLTTTDPDTNETYTYSIVGGADQAKFTIGGGSNNQLILNDGVLNHEAKSSYSVTVRVTDSASNTYDETLTVNINDLNESPAIAAQSFNVNENSVNGTVVGTVVASDVDAGVNGTLSYAITGGTGVGAFAINSTTGQITVANSSLLNFETTPSFTLTVRSSDGGSLNSSATITINLFDVNESPTDIAPNSFSINENINTAGGTSVGTLTTSDPDTGETFTYSIVGGIDQANFTIGGPGFNQLVLDDGLLNFEGKSSYSVTVRVTDSAFQSHDETLTVNVSDLNESPTVTITPLVTSLDEDADTTSAIVVATITVNDDALGSGTLSLSGADAGLFEIVGNDLRLRAGSVLDFETNPSLDVIVNVDDASIPGTPDNFAVFSLTITDVNETPTGITASFNVDENVDTSAGYSIAVLNTTDQDATDTFSYAILSGVDMAKFSIGGAGLDELILTDGLLDFEAKATYSVTVRVTDGGGNTYDQIITVSVNELNDTPTAISPTSFNVNENTNTFSGYSFGPLSATDDDATESFAYSIFGGVDAAKFSIGGVSGNELILNDGVLDYEGQNSYSVVVRVTDSGGNTYDELMTVNVNDFNEAPTVSLLNPLASIAENMNTTTSIKVADIVINDDALGTNVLSLSGIDAGKFVIVGGNELHLKAGVMLDFESLSLLNVTVSVDDLSLGGSPDHSDFFALTVLNVNESPVASDDAYFAFAGTTFSSTAGVLVNDSDPEGDPVTVTVVTTSNYGTLTVNPNGSFNYVPNSGFFGTDSFTYQINDGVNSSSLATVTLNVQASGPVPPIPANNDSNSNDGDGNPNDDDSESPTNIVPAGGPAQLEQPVGLQFRAQKPGNQINRSTDVALTDDVSKVALPEAPTFLPAYSKIVGQSRTNSISSPLDSLAGFSNHVVAKAFLKVMDEIREEADHADIFNQVMIGSTLAISTSFSVGYVIWLIRGGVLLSSVLSSMPAWRMIDPLPILGYLDDDDETDDESLETLVAKSNSEKLSTVQS